MPVEVMRKISLAVRRAHMNNNADKKNNKVKLVKSVARTIDLLTLFVRSSRYLSFQDICTMMKLPKSSAFELVQTMLFKGIIEIKDTNKRLYGLSMLAFEIGSSVIARLGVTDVARPYIQDLNRSTGGTVFLGVEDHGSIVYIDRAEDHSEEKAMACPGNRRYLHTTGLGKALLYAHSNDVMLTLLGPEPYPFNTALSHTSSVEILMDAKVSRERGYVVDDREDAVNMFCIGSAIRNQEGKPVASVSVASLYTQMNDKKKEMIARQVMDTAMEISRKLGFSGSRIYSENL